MNVLYIAHIIQKIYYIGNRLLSYPSIAFLTRG